MEEEIKKHTEFAMKLTEMKNAGLTNDEVQKQLEETAKKSKSKKQKSERLKNDAARQRKQIKEMKDLVADLSKESHENTKRLRKFRHDKPGRPALEDSYPDLHKAIVAIATAGAGADSRRRTENLNACLALADLLDCF